MCYHDIKPYAHSLTSGTMLICEISVYYMLTDHKSDNTRIDWYEPLMVDKLYLLLFNDSFITKNSSNEPVNESPII